MSRGMGVHERHAAMRASPLFAQPSARISRKTDAIDAAMSSTGRPEHPAAEAMPATSCGRRQENYTRFEIAKHDAAPPASTFLSLFVHIPADTATNIVGLSPAASASAIRSQPA
ncbi:hypothetical protein [Burkholderia sp. BDU5]|uniref:hypothetical protein n=1 Tax=Burkholderia sp. BDU5 TaxID=1385590 RepID=UPI0018D207FB|nr:hypothetical protein [Burkholderia sp. BDU5]